ncbi:MAG: hypothetical protein GWP69_02295 [Gammaproteobacteria bacterium]|jgi:hypothetical protein|nr:hypothetical protein [Gammaproteobacteria bacterium]NCF80562.1 hypothetical protein [Pseudomonadota bacterium]
MREIQGKCHCGNIAYELLWPESGKMLAVRACGCTFCTKHGGVYTSHPDARLDARVADSNSVNRYVFGTKTAEFYLCTRCGVVPFVTSTIESVEYAVVNVNTFENVDQSELDSSVSDFDGEDIEARLGRRMRNWISRVTVRAADS